MDRPLWAHVWPQRTAVQIAVAIAEGHPSSCLRSKRERLKKPADDFSFLDLNVVNFIAIRFG